MMPCLFGVKNCRRLAAFSERLLSGSLHLLDYSTEDLTIYEQIHGDACSQLSNDDPMIYLECWWLHDLRPPDHKENSYQMEIRRVSK